MRIRIAVPEEHVSPDVIDPVLEAVTRLNEAMLQQGQTPSASELARQGAVWKPEPFGDEHFDHGGTIAERGWGDCDDWAPLRAAELRATGEDPGAIARVIPSGPNTYHAIVEKSDGSIDDPSIAAGMKPLSGNSVIGQDGSIQVFACDPHDPAHIYQGSLAPTVGPLSLHCGPGFAVRGILVHGRPLFEGRCDMPIAGSRLVRVRSHSRHAPRHHRGRVHGREGALPSYVSCSGYGSTPHEALSDAFDGALSLGAVSAITSDIDQYKLLAMQGAMQGMSPGQVRQMLVDEITSDVHDKGAQSGKGPEYHTALLANQAMSAGVKLPAVVGNFFSDIGHIASGIVHDVSSAAGAVANVVKAAPWGDIVHDVQAAVSAVPGLGTAVSDVIATAETAYDSAAALLHGDPLEAAVDAAYNFALASIPGASALHPILDPVKDTLMQMVKKKEPLEDVALNALLNAIPTSPSFGSINPRSVAASLAHLIVGHLGIKKKGSAKVGPPRRGGGGRVVHVPPPPITHPMAKAILANKPPGAAHAAMHTDAVLPGSPGAPAGGTIWQCILQPGGHYNCRWV